MKIKRCILGQILSLLTVYKYTYKLTPSTFTTQVCLVPLTCLLLFSYKARSYNKRNLLGGLAGGLFYFIYIWKFTSGSNVLNIEYVLLLCSLGLFIAYIFRFLISNKENPHPFIFCLYFILLIMTSCFILKNENVTGKRFIFSSATSVLSIVNYVAYTVVTNIFANEIGVLAYTVYSSFPICIIGICCLLVYSVNDLYKESLLEMILYYVISLSVYLGTIFYIQVYGIIFTNYIHLSNMLLFLLIKKYNVFLVAPLYLILITTNLMKLK